MAALRWALLSAAQLGATVRAVFVLRRVVPTVHPLTARSEDLGVVQLAGDELSRAIRRALGEDASAQVATVIVPAESIPDGLSRAAEQAELLVIGAGDTDAHAIGGNVLDVLHKVSCPVVVVPSGNPSRLAA